MSDTLLDDVNSLLDGDFGDDRILKQIARACKNNEVISNYERNYVQKLAEQHLGRKSSISKKPETIAEIPKIEIPKPKSLITQSPPTSSSNSNNSKLLLGFGGVALAIIIVAAFAISNNIDSSQPNVVSEIEMNLSVQTDLTSYAYKDLISINGISENSNIVNLSIKNQNNQLVWAEQASVKNSGTYSTLAIAGGSGWENSGKYTVEVDNGLEKKSVTFSFNS